MILTGLNVVQLAKAVTRIFFWGVSRRREDRRRRVGEVWGGVSPSPANFCIFISKWRVFVHACMDFC